MINYDIYYCDFKIVFKLFIQYKTGCPYSVPMYEYGHLVL